MDKVFFEQLGLPEVKYNLDAGSVLHGEQTGNMLAGFEKMLLEEKRGVVQVQRDMNMVLAGALAVVKLHIKVGHVEAGLRSFDRRTPENAVSIANNNRNDFYSFLETFIAI